jgi:penicillin-binding protein 2
VAIHQDANRQLIQQRLGRFRWVALLVFLTLGVRLWQLQIVRGDEYAILAERNRIREIPLVAARGAILDRDGTPMVDNRPSYDVILYREDMKDRDATERYLVEKLGIAPEALGRLFDRNRKSPLYHPIIVKEDVGMEDISVVSAHQSDHPEVKLGSEPRRLYRYGKLAAHLLGYLGEISEKELASGDHPGARAGTLVGRSGVERSYNQTLTGRDGARRVMVDSRGREVGLLDEQPYVAGGDIRLTLDLDLQQVADQALEGRVGVVVAMDPRNGEILAMASAPSFDPNTFSPRISSKAWSAIVNDPDRPMQNRAIQNSYSPGSIFKVVMASAGLHEGALDGDPSVFCGGASTYYGRVFRCASSGGHGALHLEAAIARSCNIFFYELGRKLGIEKIARHAESLGLGSPTGIDLRDEQGGVMPSPEWKERKHGTKWYAGETISVSIGQGQVSVTPLQMLRAISAIVTGGKLTTPHVLLRADDGPGSWPVTDLGLEEAHVRRIRAGMWQSVHGGTGRNADVPGLDICGKTGTVQVVSRENKQFMRSNSENHSWFAGFANRDNPEIAVVVFVEHGGSGGMAAAPIAKKMFAAYQEKRYARPDAAEEPGASTRPGAAAASEPPAAAAPAVSEQPGGEAP